VTELALGTESDWQENSEATIAGGEKDWFSWPIRQRGNCPVRRLVPGIAQPV